MATHLDLEEQEQIDQIKSFWSRWGNLITGVITLILVGFAAWNGWNYCSNDKPPKPQFCLIPSKMPASKPI
jgi:hypothetical protein